MAYILNIDTSTQVCSVALAHAGKVVALCEADEPNIHAQMISTFVEDCVAQAHISLADIDAIAISQGPGSYTGLRIGLSTAKGLCYSLDKPLIAIDTLQAMACYAAQQIPQAKRLHNSWFAPMIDARRMEVYTAFYNSELHSQTPVEAHILAADSFAQEKRQHPLIITGDGAQKCIDIFGQEDNIKVYPHIKSSAAGMAPLSYQQWQQQAFEDLAYFTPFYLKDYIAAPSKVKGLKPVQKKNTKKHS